MAIVVVGASPGLGHWGEKPREIRKQGLPAQSRARSFLQPPGRGGPAHGLAAVTRPLARMRRPQRESFPAPSLPHPGPGRAGAVRVSRGRAANKVALRGSAATAPGECAQALGAWVRGPRAGGRTGEPGLASVPDCGSPSGPRGRTRAKAGAFGRGRSGNHPGLRGGM